MIICKNVLLHFQPGERINVLRMFHRALEPSGLLVMEHTQKMPDELSGMFRQAVNSGQVYQKI
jgi:chemotaxis protein methyltransferase CheR